MTPAARAPAPFRRDRLLAGAGLVLVSVAAFHNSLAGPWVFDDVAAIRDNPSLRAPWSVREILWPAIDGGATVSGRPVLNLSFALNRMLGGNEVLIIHATNLVIHTLAGLLLFGVVARTLKKAALAGKEAVHSVPPALAVAALWLVHPLQTESVTYMVQRAESLTGLWYLLTLYGFIRGTEAEGRGRGWLLVSGVACVLGMATKEVMVSAPLLVWVYDRTFVAGTFRDAWARRWGYYLGLAATWLVLAGLLAAGAGRGGTAGFGAGVSAWSYALTQCRAVVLYLKLVVWPYPLIFDYGTGTVGGLGEVWPQATLLLALVGATGWALVRRPVWGFMGFSFLALLAPSSSVVPVVTQTIAEHRMYLPLAIPLILIVLGCMRLGGRPGLAVCGLAVLAGGWLTVQRNRDYQTAQRLWTDTVAKNPTNGRARHELGKVFAELGQNGEALPHYQAAVRQRPTSAEAHFDLGIALTGLGRRAEAMNEFQEALRLEPAYAEAGNNLGIALMGDGRLPEAAERFQAVIHIRPDYAPAHNNLANVLLQQGRVAEAVTPAREAVRLDPAYLSARYNLGNALAETGRAAEAAGEYEAALRLRPDFPEAHNNLGNVLLQLGRASDAVVHYEAALRSKPDYAEARRNLAGVLARQDRVAEAIRHYEILRQLRPDDAAIRRELEALQVKIR